MRENYITFSYKRSVNLGNYESASAELTVHAHIDDGDDPDGCIHFLQQRTAQAVKDFLDAEHNPESQFKKIQSVKKVSGMEVR